MFVYVCLLINLEINCISYIVSSFDYNFVTTTIDDVSLSYMKPLMWS